ncbi:unnamed protein product, partial [Sphacelaria rigidula]
MESGSTSDLVHASGNAASAKPSSLPNPAAGIDDGAGKTAVADDSGARGDLGVSSNPQGNTNHEDLRVNIDGLSMWSGEGGAASVSSWDTEITGGARGDVESAAVTAAGGVGGGDGGNRSMTPAPRSASPSSTVSSLASPPVLMNALRPHISVVKRPGSEAPTSLDGAFPASTPAVPRPAVGDESEIVSGSVPGSVPESELTDVAIIQPGKGSGRSKNKEKRAEVRASKKAAAARAVAERDQAQKRAAAAAKSASEAVRKAEELQKAAAAAAVPRRGRGAAAVSKSPTIPGSTSAVLSDGNADEKSPSEAEPSPARDASSPSKFQIDG